MTRRSLRIEPFALAGIVIAVTAIVTHYGLRYHWFLPDEEEGVAGARLILDHFPSQLWDTNFFERGPERLTAFVLAIVDVIVHPTATEFSVGHAVIGAAWALTAVPTYLLARGVGIGSWMALTLAAIATFNPFSVYGVTFLDTTLGYLTVTILFYSIWRTVVKPTMLNDVLVVVALLATATARLGNAPFVLVLIPTLLVQSWRDRPE
ncbi:MAG: hypothetical protein WBD55_13350, partial [Dehalococcoidia bacterium]